MTLGIKKGKINITKNYEGIESTTITISDGEVHITATDDGINASSDTETGDNPEAEAGSKIFINGGYIVVNAGSDGLDANGAISVTKGTIVVSGANGGIGNGALDYNTTFEMTGGLLVASGGAKTPSDNSSQYSIAMSYSQMQKAGTLVSLQDSNGKTIATFAPVKDYQTVIINSPEIKKGGNYTLYSGGTSTGTGTDGLYTDGKYENGTKVVNFTVSNSITWVNELGITTAPSNMGGGGFGGKGGQRPERAPGQTPPWRSKSTT